MKRLLGMCTRWSLLPGLLFLTAASPARAQWGDPEVYQLDTWTVMVMDRSYLAIREPYTGWSGLDVLAGVRTENEPELLQVLDFSSADAIEALDALAGSGLLGVTDIEKAKELLAELGFVSTGEGGNWSELTGGELQVLEKDPGTTTIGSGYIAEAFKRLSLGSKDPVRVKVDDCTFLSGLLYFAGESRNVQEALAAKSASYEPLYSVALTVACQAVAAGDRPPGVPAGPAFPSFPSPAVPPLVIPIKPTPALPPVWIGDSCTGALEGRHATCVDADWNVCTCLCTASSTSGFLWVKTGSCTPMAPVPLPAPTTPPTPGPACEPPGGYIPCTPPTGGVCLCAPPPATAPPGSPGTVTPIPPPPPPPPTPAPTTPPSSGSAEVAVLFLLLTAIAGYRLYSQRRVDG